MIVPTRNARRTAPRKLAAKQGPEAERIEKVLATPEGQALYRRRQQIVEPVFANTKFIRGATRFQRRGLAACRAEWKLLAATHNLLKLWRAGLAPAAARLRGSAGPTSPPGALEGDRSTPISLPPGLPRGLRDSLYRE